MLTEDIYNVKLPDNLQDENQISEIVREIIRANEQRQQFYNAPFDPITGVNAPPTQRFKLQLDELTWYLPMAMSDMEIIHKLKKYRSIKKFCEQENLNGHEEMVMWALTYNRCKHDFCFWAATCCTVKDKRTGENVRFILNYPQRKTLIELERMRLADMPIRMIILKARQWGGSTLVQMYMQSTGC